MFLDQTIAPNPYLVPSWSCLTRGYVEWGYCQLPKPPSVRVAPAVPEFEWISPLIHLARNNPLGAVSAAEIRVRSNFLDLNRLRKAHNNLQLQTKHYPNPSSRTILIHMDKEPLAEVALDFYCNPEEELEELWKSQLVLLSSGTAHDERTTEGRAGVSSTWGLVLSRVPSKPDTFCRVRRV